LVGTPDRLRGIVTEDALRTAMESGRQTAPVAAIAVEPTVHVHPDHPLDVVLERFAESCGVLPVLSREEARRLEGVITFHDIAAFVQQRNEKTHDDSGRRYPRTSSAGPSV
jgi:CBS domain-containing protein